MPNVFRAIAAIALCAVVVCVSPCFAVAQGGPQVSPVMPVTTLAPEQIAAQAKAERAQARAEALRARKLHHKVKLYRAATWKWQDVMQKPRIGANQRLAEMASWRLSLLSKRWKNRYTRAHKQAHNPPNKWAWFCIHSHEAPWNSSTNPKYDGGLQMDDDFQWTYGAKLRRIKGPAYNWTMWEQIWTAVRAYNSGRGFTPWPNTARACGVL